MRNKGGKQHGYLVLRVGSKVEEISNKTLEHDPLYINAWSADAFCPVEWAARLQSQLVRAGDVVAQITSPEALEDLERGQVVHVAAAAHDIAALVAHDVLLKLVDTLATSDEERPQKELLGGAIGLERGGIVDNLADQVAEIVVARGHIWRRQTLSVEEGGVAECLGERPEIPNLSLGQGARQGGHDSSRVEFPALESVASFLPLSPEGGALIVVSGRRAEARWKAIIVLELGTKGTAIKSRRLNAHAEEVAQLRRVLERIAQR